MSVMSASIRLNAFAAANPPNPPPMITILGRTIVTLCHPLFETSGRQRHHKNENDQQYAVRRRGTERELSQLSENLHRDRPVRVRVQNYTGDELTDGRYRRKQSAR